MMTSSSSSSSSTSNCYNLTFGGVLEAAVYDGSQQLGLEDEVAEVGRVDAHIVAPW